MARKALTKAEPSSSLYQAAERVLAALDDGSSNDPGHLLPEDALAVIKEMALPADTHLAVLKTSAGMGTFGMEGDILVSMAGGRLKGGELLADLRLAPPDPSALLVAVLLWPAAAPLLFSGTASRSACHRRPAVVVGVLHQDKPCPMRSRRKRKTKETAEDRD